jgi:hypothetical protein
VTLAEFIAGAKKNAGQSRIAKSGLFRLPFSNVGVAGNDDPVTFVRKAADPVDVFDARAELVPNVSNFMLPGEQRI